MDYPNNTTKEFKPEDKKVVTIADNHNAVSDNAEKNAEAFKNAKVSGPPKAKTPYKNTGNFPDK